ncbi:MAG TPA: phosphate ABC transporter substrate-binding/OmpA family protein [Pyrinomonadaceae bacterium]|jgi:NitT/TauT family transport system substrate-binding protein|nr:phosphate ABC transporter substrate-binding/OmpA family protein [Pyrinomonadaceae bacterium]
MKLTPLAKVFISVVILGVLGYALWHYKGDALKRWAVGDKTGGGEQIASGDFDKLKGAPTDPGRDVGSTGVNAVSIGAGKLTRPLVVAINTWAGHAPGIVFNAGLEPSASSLYKKQFGMDVKFVLIEDPSAKLAAFRNGQVDIMWNTVDNWAREASTLGEQNQKGKSIILQDWSRGGDGIVSHNSIKSIEDLKGRKVAVTQFTPSHFLLLYLLSQSGLTPEQRNDVEKNIIYTQDAPAAASMFKAGQVDAAVTWEPDLSAAVAARSNEAHVLVSTTAASNIIADTLCARQELIERYPETLRDFVRGWFDGIEMMKTDPASSYSIVARALKLDDETVSGMLSGLKLTPYADNAQFYGLTGARAHYDTLFDTAFVIWRKKGLVTRPVEAKEWADTRFIQALASVYPGQKVEEKQVAVSKSPSAKDRAIINKQIQIHFTPNSDEIMPGSFFVLDSLGDTMTSFGNTVLRVEGNTDAQGNPQANMTLSERRALAVKNYIVKNFPNIPPARFQTIGRGQSNPIAENTTESGRQLNRRTDIKVVLAGGE